MIPDNRSDGRQVRDAYLSYARARSQDVADDAGYWAVDAVRDIVDLDQEAAWPLVLELFDRAEGDRMLAFIAAGPLEELIVQHGSQLIDRIEAKAAADKKFRRALSGVWGESGMSEDVLRRVKHLVRDEPPF